MKPPLFAYLDRFGAPVTKHRGNAVCCVTIERVGLLDWHWKVWTVRSYRHVTTSTGEVTWSIAPHRTLRQGRTISRRAASRVAQTYAILVAISYELL